ncbi:TonB-dependent receptor [uncultured Phocaeicola sp.]|uniref:SusC/RagA family TonB-linked outer membrane protein n=1 Tax=uncultured Phocaeicola sp. TaxID=990718 RepID=UPI0025D34BE9|nr:TonB-dependent receptor [uncultured Phocaeicola sp.]
MQKQVRLVSMLLCLGMGVAGGLPAYAAGYEVSVQQQSDVCKGVVKDAMGEPVIGASVVVKGTTNGTITDIDGNFSISGVKKGATIEVSFVGYVTQNVTWNGRPLTLTLKDDTQALDEVVVVGFGSQKKANLTGAVTTVKMDEVLGDRPLAKAADALQGAVPGLLVSSGGNSVGSSKTFQIRGAYSLGIQNSDGTYGASVAPLVLIDNVEGDIDMLNPDDIESITVLKDAASSAIYGARAAGGVILVTTKRPKGDTRFQLNYNNNFAFASAMNLPKQTSLETYLHAYQDAEGDQYWSLGAPSVSRWLELLEQYKQNPGSLDVRGDGIFKDTDGALYYLNEKDLVKNMLESSFQQTHNLSVSGGTEKLRYRLSAGMVDSDGVLITNKDSYTRMNVSSFISADITSWFTQEATLSYAHSKNSLPQSSAGGIYSTRLVSYYPEGTMPEGYGTGADDDLPFFTPKNQILAANTDKNINDNPRIFLKSILKPLKGLEIAFEYTFDKNMYDYHYYTGVTNMTSIQGGKDVYPSNDYLRKYKQYTDYNAINLYGTYSFDLAKDHHFKIMAGYNQESSYQETVDVYSYGQAVVEVPSLGGGTSTLSAKDYYTEYAVRGGFFRVNYNYKDKYLLEVNGRYDGSSRFPKDSRFGFFPSVSAGWNIAQESFMESTKDWLGMLKIRGSYGMIGNQNIVEYAFIPSMTINNKYSGWLVDGNMVTAVTSLPSLVSSSFTWEKVGTANVGLDFSLFNSRLSGLFEWYQKDTKGMLAPGMQLPAVVGASAPYQNTADMRTRGWEFNLNWRDQIGKVGYRIGFNLSDSKSEITKYDSNESKLLSSYYEGQQLGEIWGYVYDGFYTVDDFEDTQTWKLKEGVVTINGYNPRPGDVKFKNLRDDAQGENLIYEGEGTLDNPGDRKVIGNSLPRYLYGINLGVSYEGFDLSVFLQGTGKRDAWLANTLTFPMYADYKFIPLYEGLENYWKPVDAAGGDYTCANPDAEFPRIYGSYGNMGSNYRTSDRYLSDASYLRIKNVTLSYSFPKQLVKKISLSQLKAFISIENLATFSSLAKGIDPETLSWNYPAFRTVSFGLNLSL